MCEEEEYKLVYLYITVFITCYCEKLVDGNLCGYYIINAWCVLSLHICSKNKTSFRVLAVKASTFVWRLADRFSRGLCLDFVRSLMAS